MLVEERIYTIEIGKMAEMSALYEAEPVLARASEETETAFVRIMVLPRALLAKSSIS